MITEMESSDANVVKAGRRKHPSEFDNYQLGPSRVKLHSPAKLHSPEPKPTPNGHRRVEKPGRGGVYAKHDQPRGRRWCRRPH
jgi:hypothetical protein